MLLEAFAEVRTQFPDWRLVLLGDGPLHGRLRQLAVSLNISDQVFMPGNVQAVSDYLRQADIFALPSFYEGFPNALCEAMACGLPCLATDCGAVSDIIDHDDNGIIVTPNDREAMVAALSRMMGDTALCQRLGKRAKAVVERYSVSSVMDQWDALLERILTTC